jgi:hypothetical protein
MGKLGSSKTRKIRLARTCYIHNDFKRFWPMLDAELAEFDRREKAAFAGTAGARPRPAFGVWRAVRVVGDPRASAAVAISIKRPVKEQD